MNLNKILSLQGKKFSNYEPKTYKKKKKDDMHSEVQFILIFLYRKSLYTSTKKTTMENHHQIIYVCYVHK